MIRTKDKVTSLELSKKLEEEGARQESRYVWTYWIDSDGKEESSVGDKAPWMDNAQEASAFDCDELLEWIPEATLWRTGTGWYWAEEQVTDICSEVYDKPSEALGNLRLLLLKDEA